MLTQITNKIKSWFNPSYSSDLERYIISKRPKNAADVEHFTKEFEHKISQGKLL